MNEIRRTIQETKEQQKYHGHNYWPVLYILHLYGNHDARREHHCRHCKSVGIRQFGKICENCDKNDSGNHKGPVCRRYIYLSLNRLGSIVHFEREESLGVDYLLNEGERGGNHRLRSYQLEDGIRLRSVLNSTRQGLP